MNNLIPYLLTITINGAPWIIDHKVESKLVCDDWEYYMLHLWNRGKAEGLVVKENNKIIVYCQPKRD